MKRLVSLLLLAAMMLSLAACSGGNDKKQADSDVDTLVSDYGFQWTDPESPILNEEGSQAISFNIYSSKNASALDYNDMKIMQDLYESTNVYVNWENVSESVYAQQKNLIFGNSSDRPDAIYHAGMSAGEIIKYAQRNVLLPISDYLEYMKRAADATRDVVEKLLEGLPVKSISFDNGSEFSEFRQLEEHLHTLVYFAEPHKPWQRGTNENTNDMIRFFYPKGFDFRTVTEADIASVEALLNNRPRKCLDWKTPFEVFWEKSVALD